MYFKKKVEKKVIYDFKNKFFLNFLDLIFYDKKNFLSIYLKKENNLIRIIPSIKKYFEKDNNSKNFIRKKKIFLIFYENPDLLWNDINIKIKNLFYERYFVLTQLKNEIRNYKKNNKIIYLLNRISKKNSKSIFCNYLKNNHFLWNSINQNFDMEIKINIFVDKLFKLFLFEFIAIFPKNEIIYNQKLTNFN